VRGQSTVEYLLIAVIIIVPAIVLLRIYGVDINAMLHAVDGGFIGP